MNGISWLVAFWKCQRVIETNVKWILWDNNMQAYTKRLRTRWRCLLLTRHSCRTHDGMTCFFPHVCQLITGHHIHTHTHKQLDLVRRHTQRTCITRRLATSHFISISIRWRVGGGGGELLRYVLTAHYLWYTLKKHWYWITCWCRWLFVHHVNDCLLLLKY